MAGLWPCFNARLVAERDGSCARCASYEMDDGKGRCPQTFNPSDCLLQRTHLQPNILTFKHPCHNLPKLPHTFLLIHLRSLQLHSIRDGPQKIPALTVTCQSSRGDPHASPNQRALVLEQDQHPEENYMLSETHMLQSLVEVSLSEDRFCMHTSPRVRRSLFRCPVAVQYRRH